MKHLLCFCVALCASLAALAADASNDAKAIQGLWRPTSAELICYDLSGEKRPTEFKSIAGTKLYLVTYERKKE